MLEVRTSYPQGEYGVEIRIESVNKGNYHSWVRNSHGLNKLVTDLIDKEYDDNEQVTAETKREVFALKTEVFAFCEPIKGYGKTMKTYLWSSKRTVPIRERNWIDIEPGAQIDQAYPVVERQDTLLRLGHLHREDDGAIEFWRLKISSESF